MMSAGHVERSVNIDGRKKVLKGLFYKVVYLNNRH